MDDRPLPAIKSGSNAIPAAFNYFPFDVTLERAEGVYLFDSNNNRYIDISGGPMAVNIGHGHPLVRNALKQQIDRFCYAHPTIENPLRVEYSNALVEVLPSRMNSVFLVSGGSEAVETAIKIARQYHVLTGSARKSKFISYHNSYHGMTLGGMALSGNPALEGVFDPVMPSWPKMLQYSDYDRPEGVSREDWGVQCAMRLEAIIYQQNPETVAAFIATPIGAGADYGVVPPASYWKTIREICDANNVLLIADEVITGFGRTGKMFAMEHFGVEPDLITLAKGISSCAAPFGAVGISGRVADAFKGTAFLHGFTYQGHPLGCAAGLAVLKVLKDERLVQRAAELSPQLFGYSDRLLAHPTVRDVRGAGLFLAIEFVKGAGENTYFSAEKNAERLFQAVALKNGLAFYGTLYGPRRLASMGRGLPILVAPPLTITEPQIDDMMTRLDASISEWEGMLLG